MPHYSEHLHQHSVHNLQFLSPKKRNSSLFIQYFHTFLSHFLCCSECTVYAVPLAAVLYMLCVPLFMVALLKVDAPPPCLYSPMFPYLSLYMNVYMFLVSTCPCTWMFTCFLFLPVLVPECLHVSCFYLSLYLHVYMFLVSTCPCTWMFTCFLFLPVLVPECLHVSCFSLFLYPNVLVFRVAPCSCTWMFWCFVFIPVPFPERLYVFLSYFLFPDSSVFLTVSILA
jgi:hypothetical protein